MGRFLIYVSAAAGILAILNYLGVDTKFFGSSADSPKDRPQVSIESPTENAQQDDAPKAAPDLSYLDESRGKTDLSMIEAVELLHPVEADPLSRRSAQKSLVRKKVRWTGYVSKVSLRDPTAPYADQSRLLVVADAERFAWPVICRFANDKEEQLFRLKEGDKVVFTGLLYDVDGISLKQCDIVKHEPYYSDQE